MLRDSVLYADYIDACQRQVIKHGFPEMLAGNDVFNVKWVRVQLFRKQAILAHAPCASPHLLFDQSAGHRSSRR
jgi:hypothetical protein